MDKEIQTMPKFERAIARNVALSRAIVLAPGKYSPSILGVAQAILSQHGGKS